MVWPAILKLVIVPTSIGDVREEGIDSHDAHDRRSPVITHGERSRSVIE